MSQGSELSPERVLVLTPTGRDSSMVMERLLAAGFEGEICSDVDALVASLKNDAGVALIAQEALDPTHAERLLAALEEREPWSDVPILLLTLAPSKRIAQSSPPVELLERANVMLLQRPMPLHLLLSAVQSAVRARRRQYQMRDLYRELSRAVQLSEMFVGILGHDLRTPLGAIKMSAEYITRTSEDVRSVRPAERILTSADRMTRMIAQLMDFARLRQGRGISLAVVPADLRAVARQVLLELSAAHPHAHLEVSHAGNLAGRWDPDRLSQVISNLVGNAVQHGAATHPITVELDGSERESVRLSVGNLGAIPEGALPTLFEPFKRAVTSSVAEQGLGLGLFIAREIVRAHGGELIVRVAEERTTFDAKLPREARPVETDVLTPP